MHNSAPESPYYWHLYHLFAWCKFDHPSSMFCSLQITGNLLLMVFYGALLGVAAKCISGTVRPRACMIFQHIVAYVQMLDFVTTICKLALTVNNFTCCFTFQTQGLARQLPTKNNEARHSGAKLLVRPIRKKMASHT